MYWYGGIGHEIDKKSACEALKATTVLAIIESAACLAT